MPAEQLNFLGLSVISFTSNQAWGNAPATLTVTLVPDPLRGEEFTYENNGQIGIYTCHTFTAGSFRFRGFLKSFVKKRDSSSNPIYEATLCDCREVLSGTKIMTGHYYGLTNVVSNVINVFGFWENVGGFGNSQSNEAGMPWTLVLRGLDYIINQNTAPLYGGPLRYRNEFFTIDLSELPVPPAFYKIAGVPSVSLIECIDQVCNDSARDWYCELTEDNVIRIKTISRKAQLAYNRKSITQYANSISQAKEISSGWEARDGVPTSKLLFGSNVSYLYHSNSTGLYPYWGTDINGDYIYSADLGDDTVVSLNASTCFDILGTYSYSTTIGEIRIAMYSEQAWINYISIKKPDLALKLGIPVFIDTNAISALLDGTWSASGPASLIANLDVDTAKWMNQNISGQDSRYERVRRIHQLVQQAGQNYMGRSYLVALPFLVSAFDTETLETYYNYVIDTDGGYVAFGEDLLGANEGTQLALEQSPGKVGAFATYDNDNVDASQVMNTTTFVQTNGIFVEVGVDNEVKRYPFPCALVHLSNPLFEKKETIYFSPINDWISILLNGNSEDIVKDLLKNNMGNFHYNVGAVTRPKIPNYISIPLRSKVETYGGSIIGRGYWYLAGIPGNTEVEQDDNLNPWSYGGYFGMFLAATAKLFQVSSQNYAVEFGSMSFPGLPNHSLGQELFYQGSNITSIDVSVSSNGGFSTNYRLRAFDPNIFGSLAKREEARFQRIGNTLRRLRSEARQAYDQLFSNVGPISNASIQNYMSHPTLSPRSPHGMLAARHWNFTGSTAFHEVAQLTPTEALANIDTRSSTSFKNFSMMSMNGMFRPFSTNTDRTDMPVYTRPVANLVSPDYIYTSITMNPFRSSNDIAVYSKGDNMTEDARTLRYNPTSNTLDYDHQGDYENVRGVGIKGPINLVGYGFDLNCKATTSGDTNISETDRKNSQKWKAGPLDPLFDQTRGCWTFHDTVYGKVVADIAAKSSSSWVSGGLKLLGREDTNLETTIEVYNIHNATIPSGTTVTATYNSHANRFVIQSADC